MQFTPIGFFAGWDALRQLPEGAAERLMSWAVKAQRAMRLPLTAADVAKASHRRGGASAAIPAADVAHIIAVLQIIAIDVVAYGIASPEQFAKRMQKSVARGRAESGAEAAADGADARLIAELAKCFDGVDVERAAPFADIYPCALSSRSMRCVESSATEERGASYLDASVTAVDVRDGGRVVKRRLATTAKAAEELRARVAAAANAAATGSPK